MTKHQNFKLLPNRMIGVEAISADSSLTFGKHTHDPFGVGLMDRSGHMSASGRGTVEAWAGDVTKTSGRKFGPDATLAQNFA